jgi:hypothetical protein
VTPALLLLASALLRAPLVIDAFDSTAAWSAFPADGVQMKLSSDAGQNGRALRIDFDFKKGGGYAVVHRAVNLTLPDRYAFALTLRGECLRNNLEIKLIDSTGANVWWCNRRDFDYPREWKTVLTRHRQITFAWGPAGGGDIRRVAAIEFAVTAGQGGKGTVWLDQLELRDLPPPSEGPPHARASSSAPGHAAALAVDADSTTAWRSTATDRSPWIELDFGGERELSGLRVDWVPGRHPRRYAVEALAEEGGWRALRTVVGDGGRDWIFLPETEARALRLSAFDAPKGGCALAGVAVEPLAWAPTREAFFQKLATESPRGDYPRGISGEQSYWTVVGLDGDEDEGLVSEDGAVEAGKRGFSIEPFLRVDGKLWTWADARIERSLFQNRDPLPSVQWHMDSLDLRITVTPVGTIGAGALECRYEMANRLSRSRDVRLFLAIRPFQVNPPTQNLNTQGGCSPIRAMRRDGRHVWVWTDRGEIAIEEDDSNPPADFGALTFDRGNIVSALRSGTLPKAQAVTDTFEFASGALSYGFRLGPRDLPARGDAILPISRVVLRVALRPGAFEKMPRPVKHEDGEFWNIQRRVTVELPSSAASVADALQAQLGFILVNRDGPAIKPGTRAYDRSWIRDGSLTSTALLRLGRPDVVKDFIEWFGSFQYDNGKIPCCVDQRGADPVPEHDSHGEFIYIVAEYYRYTGDRASAERWWPRVARAAGYLDTLRAQRLTAEYRAADRREFYGILPPSISHEGYSAKPMHSYWDDLFALRGYQDAAFLARELGHRDDAKRLERTHADFARDLGASIRAAMAKHKIDYVPGCADLGDYDATSTTIALEPVQVPEAVIPRAALERTFQGYWDFFEKRRDGRETWEAFTPYEWRTVGAFVRLGWRDRAAQALEWFMKFQRPPGWPQWPEVVWRDERAPHFLGDLPHTWVGSDFVRSALDMFAYERESDESMVLLAGAPKEWLPLSVRGLMTREGALDISARPLDAGAIEVKLHAPKTPRGGFIIAAPGVDRAWRAKINGSSAPISAKGEVIVRQAEATVILSPPPGHQ